MTLTSRWRTDEQAARRPRGILSAPGSRPRRRAVALAVVAAAVLGGFWWLRQGPPPEPGVLHRVSSFVLKDPSGRVHTPADWSGSRAVVLLFLGAECPISNAYAPEMRRLAGEYGPRGVAFRGVYPDPDVTAEAAARHARQYGLEFPTLLDPRQELAERAGVTVTPEAVVLDGRGDVRYRGRIDDRYGPDRRRRSLVQARDLRDALEAVLAGRPPEAARTEAAGCPLPALAASLDDEEIVYTKHVAPILWRRCAGCHRPGEVAPFSLLSYHDAARRAEFLRDITAERRMPPWKARHGFGAFRDEPRLTGYELAVLARWADSGAPEGDPADLPDPPRFPAGWQLGEPDLVLEMPEPFLVPADEDIYRAFVLPVPLDADSAVAAIEFRPGNRKVVHHARFYVDSSSDCRLRDRLDVAPGFPTVGGNDIPKPTLGAWIPGSTPRMPPEGVGLVLKAGSDLVLLLHYHGSGKPEADRSSVGIYFAKTPVTRSMYTIPLSTVKIDIPPGEPRHRIVQLARLPADVHAYSVMPHGHYLMREIKLWATLPDGTTERLLWIDDWDFTWQGQYHCAQPVRLPAGTRLHLIAHYDNSAGNPWNPSSPPIRVRYGQTSRDEMLGCYIQILPDGPDQERKIREKGWQRSL